MGEPKKINESSHEKHCTKVFLDSFKSPTLISAKFASCIDSNILVNVNFRQRDYELSNSTFAFQQSVFLKNNLLKLMTTPPVYSNELLNAVSPNGIFKAVIREIEKASKKLYKLEIWKSNDLIKNIDLTALKIHGNVYGDETFGCLKWSTTNDKLVYIAEKYVEESEPFYKRKAAESETKSVPGQEYVKIDDWGEFLESKHNTVVVMWHADKELPIVLDHIPKDISPSKLVWAPDGDGIVGVGYVTINPRLGVIYCTNRPSCLFYTKYPDVFVVLNDESMAVNSPRFSPSGKSLIWLERPVGGPHHAGQRLMKLNWDLSTVLAAKIENTQKSIVVDAVDTCVKTTNNKSFYGIYCVELPHRCWSSIGEYLLFSTPKECFTACYIVDVESKALYEIDTHEQSCTVLDVYENYALFGRSNFKTPIAVYASIISDPTESVVFEHVISTVCPPVYNEMIIDRISLSNSNVSPAKYWSILLQPKQNESSHMFPLIVALHGGPHSCNTDTFSSICYYFVQMGFAVLLVNYHGSIGMGEKSLRSLIGKIGSLDADDVHIAVKEVLSTHPVLDKNNVMLFGGSHGGYLVTMLSGLYPDFYKAVVARNPVTNLPLALWTSDIPDWAAVESGVTLPTYGKDVLTMCTNEIEIIQKMVTTSPTNLIKSVVAPTLLLVGKDDLRVPPHQSFMYSRMLRERNIKTKLLLYDDNHSLSKAASEMDGTINAVLWFIDNCSTTNGSPSQCQVER